jgi:Predicted nucleotide-binding protein containing TIR-like domain
MSPVKSARPSQRRTIFIISSKEARPIAAAVKQNFDIEADVDVWDEDIFKVNRNYLYTLLNYASYYDFAIGIFAADDAATIRRKRVKVPRGNVIFEFGLFLGRLGPDRAFLVREEGVDPLSDWSGIETASFRRRDNLVAAVRVACDRIREEMAVADKLEHFSMLPSTSLAIGYYNNFLKRVFDAFELADTYSVVMRDDRGQIVEKKSYRITDRHPLIHVKLPQHLSDLEPEHLKRRTCRYRQIAVSTQFREFPFYIVNPTKSASGTINLFDIPTTMLASKIAIERSFTREFLARGNTLEHFENREIANFERTLRLMVPDKIEDKYFKFSVLR